MTSIEQLYEVFLQHPDVTTDSRNCPEGSMFFALKGDNFDGNLYAARTASEQNQNVYNALTTGGSEEEDE